jgi:hypothetical protein
MSDSETPPLPALEQTVVLGLAILFFAIMMDMQSPELEDWFLLGGIVVSIGRIVALARRAEKSKGIYY